VTRAGLDKQPRDIAAMFDGVARGYDRTNTVLSAGQDRWWRRQTRRALGPRPGERVLDVAAGTGVSTVELSRSGAYAVGVDISLGMLRAGMPRLRGAGGRLVDLAAGDALALPFADGVFDAVTISFGLRNVQDTGAALAEFARVTRPGGRLVVCEFSRPTWAPFRAVYLTYLMRALPVVARRVASNPEAYTYLAESIRAWPDQAGLAARIGDAGWSEVSWRNLSGGVVALHRAVRGAAGGDQSVTVQGRTAY
jgi:demethylmenaquinone methyltransferase / 2-methoxy-6-polyprenyl-1,4-benzoquinol methylase